MKKTRIINFGKFGLITFSILLASAQLAFCAESFQNNLLKADVYKSPVGGIKITLFTSKPYNDSVIVNKKSDYEYVILMPETSNSMTAKPSLKFVDDVVKSVEVKTQQYANQVKGYTKIVISTSKPVEINSQVQTLKTTDYKLADNDYKELFAQTLKNKASSVKKEVPKLAPRPTAQKAKPSSMFNSPNPALATKVAPKVAPQPKMATQKVVPKPVAVIAPVEQSVDNQIEQKAPVADEKITPATSEPPVVTETVEPIAVEKKAVEIHNAFNFKNIKRIIKNNFYSLLGFLAAMFILLLLVARKINRNQDKQKEIFTNHLDEKPETITNYEENITEDMTWKEKFQTYVETSQAQQEPSAQEPSPVQAESNPDLNDLFSAESVYDEVEEETLPQEFLQQETVEETRDILDEMADDTELNELISKEDFGNPNASLDDIFGDEETEDTYQDEAFDLMDESAPELYYDEVQEETQADEFVKAEFAIDDKKGFYLVDFEDTTALVGHIGEEIFILKRFETKLYGTIQARLNERNGLTESYMTKVGDFRAMVEVTPENMNLLIEL